MGVADVLTMASQRSLMSNEQLVQEHDFREITKNFPVWNQSDPEDEEYQRLKINNYEDWVLPVTGMVNNPTSVSLSDLKKMPRRAQTTMHICEQGWSAIAEWTGTPLLSVIQAAGGIKPEAKYVKFISVFDPQQMVGQRRAVWPGAPDTRVRESSGAHRRAE